MLQASAETPARLAMPGAKGKTITVVTRVPTPVNPTGATIFPPSWRKRQGSACTSSLISPLE